MSIEDSYNAWAPLYDTNENKTRDLEALALRSTLANIPIGNCLEIGCGTGKNSAWLATWAKEVVAVDFSEEMLSHARTKTDAKNISFIQADVTGNWFFADRTFQMITFSLVLEHMQNLHEIFSKANAALQLGGYVYVGELHPFRQYGGSKARFDTGGGTHVVDCYTHHISEFADAAAAQGWQVKAINEFFDEADRTKVPRLLVLVFYKPVANA